MPLFVEIYVREGFLGASCCSVHSIGGYRTVIIEGRLQLVVNRTAHRRCAFDRLDFAV